MMTPEGREKAKVRKYLAEIGAYVFAPVQQGYGQQTLDILACVNGTFWGIEVKKEGGKLTARQRLCCEDIKKAGGCVVWGTADVIIEQLVALKSDPAVKAFSKLFDNVARHQP